MSRYSNTLDARLEADERWAARRCVNLAPTEADRLFFTKGGRAEALRLFCGPCPAREDCLELALTQDEESEYVPHGVRGGHTAGERALLIAHRAGRRMPA